MRHLRYGLEVVGTGLVGMVIIGVIAAVGAAPMVALMWWSDGVWWSYVVGIPLTLILTATLASWLAGDQ